MQMYIEIFKLILPSIISGLITFYITKYSYHNNRPLDKLEITYNKVYYPLYRLITNPNLTPELIMEKSKKCLRKYHKYIDRSTLKAFRTFQECKTRRQKKAAYENFKNNIYEKDSYLRIRLGYLNPNLLQMYAYSSKKEQATFRIVIYILIIYLCACLLNLNISLIHNISVGVLKLIVPIFVIEVIVKFIMFLLNILLDKFIK